MKLKITGFIAKTEIRNGKHYVYLKMKKWYYCYLWVKSAINVILK